MATLTVGTVTIADDGTASGSGMALDLFNAEDLARGDIYEMLGTNRPSPDLTWRRVTALRCARLAGAHVTAIQLGVSGG
jgi:hypothetical protein